MNDKITFEEGLQELEELVHRIESGQLPLEDSFKAYERAMQLKSLLTQLLDEGDKRIRLLTEAGETDMTKEVEP